MVVVVADLVAITRILGTSHDPALLFVQFVAFDTNISNVSGRLKPKYCANFQTRKSIEEGRTVSVQTYASWQ